MTILAYFHWNPTRALLPFDLPLLGRPIQWYGFFFALGFACSIYAFRALLSQYMLLRSGSKDLSQAISIAKLVLDRSLILFGLGMLIGARLFDILFYQGLDMYFNNPLGILKIWEGGLASHGGALGLLAAGLYLVKKQRVPFSFITLIDILFPASLIAAFWIRIGNFFNQEILGHITTLPWGVIFGDAVDGGSFFPRHPVQLYEALFYLLGFVVFFILGKKSPLLKYKGLSTSLLFILIFGFRFMIEFLKTEQSSIPIHSSLTMGQLLSLPLLVLGCFMLFRVYVRNFYLRKVI